MNPWIATAFGLAMTGLGVAITDLDSCKPSLALRKRVESLTRRTMIQFRVFVLPAVIPRFARPYTLCCAHRPEREKP